MMFSLDKISKTKLVTILNHIVPYSSMHSSKMPYKYKLYLNDISKHIFNFINEGRSLLLGHLKNTSQVKRVAIIKHVTKVLFVLVQVAMEWNNC